MNASPHVRPPRRDNEEGDTLIEVLIALLILSITVVALISAFSTSIAASAQYRNIAVTDSIVRTLSEEVIAQFQQGTSYIACPNGTPSNYTNGFDGSAPLSLDLVVPAPYTFAGYSAAITGVGYWTGSNFDATSSTCTTGSTVPEELTVTITGPSGSSETLTFIVEGSGQIFATAPTPLDPPTNIVLTTPGSPDSGGLTVSFTASANAPADTSTFTQYYTVVACTNSAMTLGCTYPETTFLSGEEIHGLAPGTPYWVGVSANSSPGYLASGETIGGPQDSSGQATLQVLSVSPSTTTVGALVVTFSTPSSAPSGETYAATACTDSAMTQGCVSTPTGFSSGSQITGLTPGTAYYVDVSAPPNGTYPALVSPVYSPAVNATVQLNPPTGVSVSSSTVQAGALVVTFTNSNNAPAGQTYTVKGCTDSAMSSGCVSQTNYTSGQQFGGLTQGTSYYVTVTAVASTGYLASSPSAVPASPTMASIQLISPSITSVTAPTKPGTLKVSFNGSPNAPNGESYTILACTNTNMTQGCQSTTVKKSSSSMSGTVTGLTSGETYYVTVTANAMSGYLASNPSAQATGVPN